jgi:hypothetical protein
VNTTNRTFKLVGSVALAALVIHSVVPSAKAGVAVSIGQNFTGSIDTNNFYPQPAGGVSEDYFVEFNIDTFAVYDKADGSLVQSMTDADFWAQAGIPFPLIGARNARVVYDPTVQRWFAVESTAQPAGQPHVYHFLLGVSATADPTGSWNGLYVTNGIRGTNFAAFQSMGLDAQGIYVSQVVGIGGTNIGIGSTLFSLPKADLLLVPPVITNQTFFGPLSPPTYGYDIKAAVCLDGSAAGDVLATAGHGDPGENDTNLFAFAVLNSGGPGPATLSSPTALPVPAYVDPRDALQPDGSANLVDDAASFTADVCCVGGVLFAAGETQVPDPTQTNRVAVRWYRVGATNYTLLESGTISAPGLDLYYPSVAANTNGTVVIACNGSGTNTFVSCYAMVGQTVNGVTTFGEPLLLKAGAASYQNPLASPNQAYSGWGEYSTTSVDPTDPNVFWTINAYAYGTNTWATQITQILTSPSPLLSISSTSSNLVLSWPVTTVPFQLESAAGLSGGTSWSPVTQTAITNGSTVSVPVPATNGSAFFRLVQTQ